MESSEGNYHRRGPYFDGTKFASWKHKMKMHILGHNPAVWAIVCIGLHGEFFDAREPNHEATAKELKMLQYNAQACDILFNGLCRMWGSGKPLRFEHWGAREVFPSYRSTP